MDKNKWIEEKMTLFDKEFSYKFYAENMSRTYEHMESFLHQSLSDAWDKGWQDAQNMFRKSR